jgi:hypothetical protein
MGTGTPRHQEHERLLAVAGGRACVGAAAQDTDHVLPHVRLVVDDEEAAATTVPLLAPVAALSLHGPQACLP